jgi:hypothetical protein
MSVASCELHDLAHLTGHRPINVTGDLFSRTEQQAINCLSCSPFQVAGTKIRCSLSSLSEWPQLSRAGGAIMKRRLIML